MQQLEVSAIRKTGQLCPGAQPCNVFRCFGGVTDTGIATSTSALMYWIEEANTQWCICIRQMISDIKINNIQSVTKLCRNIDAYPVPFTILFTESIPSIKPDSRPAASCLHHGLFTRHQESPEQPPQEPARWRTTDREDPKGQLVEWNFWVEAFNHSRSAPLEIHRKLTYKHVFPENAEKMRNHLAEEVLNEDMLQLMLDLRAHLGPRGAKLDATISLLQQTSILVNIFRDRPDDRSIGPACRTTARCFRLVQRVGEYHRNEISHTGSSQSQAAVGRNP